MSRAEDRSGFDVPTRVRLLETDADVIESLLYRHIEETAESLEQLVRETRTQTEALRESVSQNARVGVGVLASLCVACVLFAIQIVVR